MTAPRLPRAARVLLFGLLPLVSVGCGPTPTPSSAEQAPKNEPTEPAVSEEQTGEAVPVIASEEATFDFGTISPSDKVTHVFKIQNRGTADLHIERVERT